MASNEVNVKTDPRLKSRAIGDGASDDTAAIRDAIRLASSTASGGVVYFPAGDYLITTPSGTVSPSGVGGGAPLVIPSRVILRGDSSSSSRLHVSDPNTASETDWIQTWGGITLKGSSLGGLTDLGIYAANPSSNPGALLWNRGSGKVKELFFNNLDIHLENSKNFWFETTDDLLIQNCHFDSTALKYGPIYVVNDSHVAFLGNQISYHFGRVQMQSNLNLLMQHNVLIRDAENLDLQDKTAIESGGVELSFGQNLQVLDNSIQTLNAPASENADGEAIMAQQSTIMDMLDVGSVTTATASTLSDSAAMWGANTVTRLGQFPEVAAILTGPSRGEWRALKSLDTTTKTLTFDQPWDTVPEAGSLYSVFAWTLRNAVIQGNTLTDNPNGIVLWDGCYDCTVQNNTLTNSRGIILRTVDEALSPSLYPEGRRVHQIAIQVSILNNTVSNTSGFRPAYVALDAEAFDKTNYRGAGMIEVQLGGNVIEPYAANPSQTYGPIEISQDGFFPCFLFGPAGVKDPLTTVFEDIYFWNNSQRTPVTYVPYFSQFATHSCVTPSAPPNP